MLLHTHQITEAHKIPLFSVEYVVGHVGWKFWHNWVFIICIPAFWFPFNLRNQLLVGRWNRLHWYFTIRREFCLSESVLKGIFWFLFTNVCFSIPIQHYNTLLCNNSYMQPILFPLCVLFFSSPAWSIKPVSVPGVNNRAKIYTHRHRKVIWTPFWIHIP